MGSAPKAGLSLKSWRKLGGSQIPRSSVDERRLSRGLASFGHVGASQPFYFFRALLSAQHSF